MWNFTIGKMGAPGKPVNMVFVLFIDIIRNIPICIHTENIC